MKTIYFAILAPTAAAIAFTSCGKDETPEEKLNTNAVTIDAGKTYQLSLLNGTSLHSCSSDNTFVATVSNTGLVTAVRRGTCTITANGHKCTVTVATTINDIPEPMVQWGISEAQLKEILGNPSNRLQQPASQYWVLSYTLSGKAKEHVYVFDTQDKLIQSTMHILAQYDDVIDPFLSERYKNVNSADPSRYQVYLNGSDISTATLKIGRYLAGSTTRAVVYLPND